MGSPHLATGAEFLLQGYAEIVVPNLTVLVRLW